MPQDNQQPTPPDQLGDIIAEAGQQTDEQATKEAVARIRDSAGLPGDADEEILGHYFKRVEREIAEQGDSDLQARWLNRTKAPEAWSEVESQLTQEMRVKAARYREAPRVPAGHPAHRHLTAVERSRMTDRQWSELKADELHWSELSAAEKRDLERNYASRRKQYAR